VKRRAVHYENAERAVFLTSDIDYSSYEKLAPTITNLRLKSAAPICLYIHSYGGSTFVAERLLRLFRAPRQDNQRCLLTTVCLGYVASAAADMLSSGDYAIAYSDSTILHHGTLGQHSELTLERLREVEETLEFENEYFARKLANRMFRRFATQALLLEAFRSEQPSPKVTAVAADPVQILGTIRQKVQSDHANLISAAVDRFERIQQLFTYVNEKKKSSPLTDPISEDCAILKLLADFESGVLQQKKSEGEEISGFSGDTIRSIQDNFESLKEFSDGSYLDQARDLCQEKGHYFLTHSEMEEFEQIEDHEEEVKFLIDKTLPRVLPLWFLVMSLCRLLQQGEHRFSAHDAVVVWSY
jgi:ATP-dependent protease ClpP protease subunit